MNIMSCKITVFFEVELLAFKIVDNRLGDLHAFLEPPTQYKGTMLCFGVSQSFAPCKKLIEHLEKKSLSCLDMEWKSI